MKHFKYIILIVLYGITVNMASAQKGMQGIGGNIGLGFDLDDYGAGALCNITIKYQYNISNYYRIEPIILYQFDPDYAPTSYVKNNLQIGINNHLFFTKVRRLRPYFILGVGLGSTTEYDAPRRYVGGYVNSGVGLDYRFSYKLSGEIEFCYEYGNGFDYQFAQCKIGLTYNF